MKQPDLGKLIAATRSGKKLSQESLAEACDISARTVQRIESGSVVPHSYTLQSICDVLDLKLTEDGAAENHVWLAIIHFSSLFLFLPVPLAIWAWKGPKDEIVTLHCKKALNFQLTWSILLFSWFGLCSAAVIFWGVLGNSVTWAQLFGVNSILLLLLPIAAALFITYHSIVNVTRAISMKEVHYPWTIAFWK